MKRQQGEIKMETMEIRRAPRESKTVIIISSYFYLKNFKTFTLEAVEGRIEIVAKRLNDGADLY